uniref:Uncharacterized protein n=1 Tax=Arundo donax TaxID=35708 RepID=A0A0A8YXR9_ARUDO
MLMFYVKKKKKKMQNMLINAFNIFIKFYRIFL